MGESGLEVSHRHALLSESFAEVDERARETDPPHDYHAGRCINCDTNWIDEDLYGPYECKPHPPLRYTTTTGDPAIVMQVPEDI